MTIREKYAGRNKIFLLFLILIFKPSYAISEAIQYGNCQIDPSGLEKLSEGYYRDHQPITISRKMIYVAERADWARLSDSPTRLLEVSGDLKLILVPGQHHVSVVLDSSLEDSFVWFSDFSAIEIMEKIDCLKAFGISPSVLDLEMEKSRTGSSLD